MVDLGRLKSLKPVLHFLYMNAMRQPHIFSLDYEHWLRAAFLREDFEIWPPEVGVFTTFKIPVLHMVKTPDRALPQELRTRSRAGTWVICVYTPRRTEDNPFCH